MLTMFALAYNGQGSSPSDADDIFLFQTLKLSHKLGKFRPKFFSSSLEGEKVHSQNVWDATAGFLPLDPPLHSCTPFNTLQFQRAHV